MNTRRKTAQTGFTLMELLMTIAIAAIVAMIGIPSFQYVTNSNRIAGEVNGLLGDLQFARAEAIKEGQNVTVCMSAAGATCDTTGAAWQTGWIVYSNPTGTGANTTIPAAGSILRVQSPFTSTDTFVAAPGYSAITYNREGYAVGLSGSGTLITLHDSTGNANWTRCVSVNLNGMSFSLRVGTTNGVTCS